MVLVLLLTIASEGEAMYWHCGEIIDKLLRYNIKGTSFSAGVRKRSRKRRAVMKILEDHSWVFVNLACCSRGWYFTMQCLVGWILNNIHDS
mmetsp:Transcript_28857/g.52256  ORF Transcript_28857/g.52256 Transcript_28857/m.52256 type:complete len:91 (+) Transcript_28857:304-576(+)